MNAAEQHKEWGAAVESSGDSVILQVGTELVSLTPEDARRLMFYMARAHQDALYSRRRKGRPNAPTLEGWAREGVIFPIGAPDVRR